VFHETTEQEENTMLRIYPVCIAMVGEIRPYADRIVQFTYAIWDRIVLRGYYDRLQRPENIVYFLREVCGIAIARPPPLDRRPLQAFATPIRSR
jgi:hypothetical protein